MKHNTSLFHILRFGILILLLNSCVGHQGDKNLVIGESGNLKTIVIPDHPDEVTLFAASELQRYLEKITGTRLDINKLSGVEEDLVAIRLIPGANSELKWDGFSVETSSRGVLLSASEPRGLLYAVYTLLEEAGCSFFYPGSNEEVVPKLGRVEFQQGSKIYNPLVEHRGIAPYGLQASSSELGRDIFDWMAKNKFNFVLVSEDRPSDCVGSAHGSVWKEVSHELLPELQKRGFIIEMSEHCTHVFFPRSLFELHPDWFAMNNGERKLGEPPYSGQMCYSNPDAVEYYTSALAEYAAIHPEFHVIGTWPLDGGEYCECEKCKNPQTVFNAARRAAEKIKEVRPDMIVEHLAYKPQTWQPPPMDQIPDNMSVLWCPDIGKMDTIAGEWIQKSGSAGGVYLFEYYMGDNYRSRANVLLRPDFSLQLAQHAHGFGFRGVTSLFLPMENWWRSCFNNWFFARACWDPDFSVNAGLSEYCKKYYGTNAGEVEEIFGLILSGLHPDPILKFDDEALIKQSSSIELRAKKILDRLDQVISETNDSRISERLVRLKTYIEFHQIYIQAFSSGKPADLERLINYSAEHPNQDMVLMYPEYIRWRNGEYF